MGDARADRVWWCLVHRVRRAASASACGVGGDKTGRIEVTACWLVEIKICGRGTLKNCASDRNIIIKKGF